MERRETVRLALGSRLLERIDAVAGQLGMEREEMIRYALEREIARQEVHCLKDEITLQEISHNVVAGGQTLPLPLAAENEALQRELSTCQMCLREFDRPPSRVEGPLFCEECLGLARGGDFSVVEPGEL